MTMHAMKCRHYIEDIESLQEGQKEGVIWVCPFYMTIEGVRIEPLMLLCGRTEAPLTSSSSLMATAVVNSQRHLAHIPFFVGARPDATHHRHREH